ncbi:M28 family metallopeptidase [Mucilaginibacter arboris]|uniref:M28 family peptidase n=1 Tax=Mucilaginibacter arboris TaxID=2682090 RepID=A0A7K1SV29_9SPHI|nr:M28 family peptidase [Mucilaginibacter arboris]MVN21098.1 M28 family peptidase [Mucilaginibacter arboris]
MKKTLTILLLAGISLHSFGQVASKTSSTNPPELSLIKEAELKKDIFELAGDAFRGRRAGTLDEMRAAAWVAQKAQEIGLKPAGDDGTYFQFFNMHRTQTSSLSTLQINNQKLELWKDYWVTQPITIHVEAPLIWLNSMADTTQNLQGKIAVVKIVAPKPLPAPGMSLWGYRYTALAIRQQSMVLRRKGAAAVILIADDVTQNALDFVGNNFQKGTYRNEGLPITAPRTNMATPIPVILVRSVSSNMLQQNNSSAKIDLKIDDYLYPSVNVVAKVEGTDAQLRKEYVLFSGHHDHDGVGYNIVGKDSIWNGADDNASVTVGMLAIARAWKAKPGKRSALFVWHGAEERGLLGSRWYAVHPTVPKEAIVAVLNGDMIGRNAPDSAALLGTTSHKNSTQLVDMAMKANAQLTHFKVDFSWDDAKHPEGWYFRSDHLPYAQVGIPSIFFTTLLHADYHTPKDEPDRIDMAKLAKMSKWWYATGWLVSQTPQKPALDKQP